MEKEISLAENENIETLFKVEPPLTSLENEGYFGYMGVILRNKVEDKIQCHLCGNFYEQLSLHVIHQHKIKLLEYRHKFQLPLNFPLCSLKISESARETIQKNSKNRKLLTGEEFQKRMNSNQGKKRRNHHY